VIIFFFKKFGGTVMKKKYIITLTDEERKYLEDIVNKGKNPAYRIKHANILLNAESGKPDNEISDRCRCHINTVANVRQRFVEEGMEAALERKKRDKPPVQAKLDGEKEARLIAIACSKPPEGYAKWTPEMIADRMVELKIVDSVSDSTVCRALKKTNSGPISAGSG
jgi:transposase